MKFLYLSFILLLSSQLASAQIYDDEITDTSTVIRREQKERKKVSINTESLFVGSTFSFGIGNYLLIDVSPFVGYHLHPNLGVGVGGTYVYLSQVTTNGSANANNIFGGRLFLNYRPFGNSSAFRMIYLHAEGEYLSRQVGAISGGRRTNREGVPAVYLGAGINYNFDEGFSFIGEFLINALWFEQSKTTSTLRPIYSVPWQYRVGISYAF